MIVKHRKWVEKGFVVQEVPELHEQKMKIVEYKRLIGSIALGPIGAVFGVAIFRRLNTSQKTSGKCY